MPAVSISTLYGFTTNSTVVACTRVKPFVAGRHLNGIAHFDRRPMHARFSLRTVVSCLAIFAITSLALLASATPAHAQVGTTADLVVGRVIGPDTLPLRDARVEVTSVESGITRTKTTGDDGRYSIVFPDGGGQYVVTVHYLGMRPTRALVRRQADEDRLVANIQLTAAPVILSTVNVDATRNSDTLAAGAGSLGQVLTRELLDQLGYLGNEAAALALITPGVTLLQGADSSMSAISIAGEAPTQTGHLVDGTQSGSSLPREAVKSTNVITSAYDVSYGQFSGGYVEQSTVSGTNKVRGSLTSSAPLAPVGDLPARTGVLSQRRSGVDIGGNIAGPLRKDHLFASFAMHSGHTTMPGASVYTLDPAALDRMGVARDSVTRFLQILDAAGVGGARDHIAGQRDYGNRSLFGRVDFTPSERHTVTLSANESKFWTHGWFSGPLATPSSGGEYANEDWRAALALTSHLGAWVNDARASVSGGTNGTTARLSAASGVVVIPSTQSTASGAPGIATLTFGGNPYAPILTSTSTLDAKDELSWLSDDGAHRVKFGAGVTRSRSSGAMPANRYGTYRFNSLADLEAGRATSFARSLIVADRNSGGTDASVYVGDAWRTGPTLQLVYGLRLEGTSFANAPTLNPEVASAFGVRNDVFPGGVNLTPRIGFTYFVGATDSKPAVVTVRGGLGIFRSGANQAASLFAAARNATGLPSGQIQVACVGSNVPQVEWDYFESSSAQFPSACTQDATSATPTTLPRVIAIDPSFRLPHTVRASLGASRQIAKIWSISLDGSFSNGYDGTVTRDLNLVPAPRFTLANEDGRPVFVAPSSVVPATGAVALAGSRVNPAFGSVSLASSSLRTAYRSVSASLGRTTPKAAITLSYTHAWARSQVSGDAGGGGFGFGSTTAGDPRTIEWVRNPWTPPDQARAFITYHARPWLDVTPSFFAQRGYAFEPMVNGDINGDGLPNDRAFAFDPAHTADTAIANGMQRLLASAPASVRRCLQSQMGTIARAGSCEVPWFMGGGLSIKLAPPWNGKRLSISIQTNNAVSGLDLLLHGQDHLHGWGQFPNSNRTLLYVRGFDPATQQYRYAVNERFGTTTTKQNVFVQPMQLTMVAQLALGRMQSGSGMLGTPMPPARTMTEGHADTLRTRIARTLPNVFRRTVAVNDSSSLGLSTDQLAQLHAKGDAYQPRADSLTSAIVAVMTTPMSSGSSPSTIATRLKSSTDAGHALLAGALTDLRAILTPTQFEKLPAELTRQP